MKSSKWMIGLVAVVLMLALAPNSFAQIQLRLFNTASEGEISTNHNANTADVESPGAGLLISGELIAASSLTTTQLTLTFPAIITSRPAAFDGTIAGAAAVGVPSSADGIRIEGATGLFASVTAVASVNFAGGTITVTLPGFPPPAGNSLSGSFRISGIRFDLEGESAPLALSNAQLSSSANNYIAPNPPFPGMIDVIGSGFTFTQGTISGATNAGTTLMFANQSGITPADATASILFTEGFATAWRTAAQTATTGIAADIRNGTNILLGITGMPSGVTATLSRVCSGACAGSSLQVSGLATLTAAATQMTIIFDSTALNATETLAFNVALSGAPATIPMTPGNITMTATLTPNATAGLTGGVPTFPAPGMTYPRFEVANTTITIGTITQATTTMLIPFVVKVGTTFDTGIAISNTTLDPFTTGGATPTAGAITFDLFPRSITGTTGSAGTRTTVTTSATVRPGLNGGGLDAAGLLPAGGLWTATLSELMTAGSVSGDFYGYVFIQTNFVDAHGVSYIMQNFNITSTVPLLILPPPLATDRDTTTAESLSF